MRVAIYCRVSTDQQVRDGDSIQAQLSALRSYSEKHGYDIAGEYIDDGVSGTLLNERDELQHLLDDVKAGKIDILIFTKLDRYFRNLKHYLNTQEILDKYNVPWVSIWENYETKTPQGRLMVNQMLSFAQFEAEQTGQRINQVFSFKKQNHEVLSGKIPYGFKIVDKHLVPDPEKAEIIRNVFKTYIATGSICETLRQHQGNGMPTTQRAIKLLLQNRKYIGECYGIENYHEPIIDIDTFDAVQDMLSRNIRKERTFYYIFTGLVYCPDCGKRMTGTTDVYKAKKIRYKTYQCMGHYRTIPNCGNTRSLNELKLEKYLVKNLENLAFAEVSAKDKKKAVSYEKQITATEKKISKLKELYVNELITLDEYKHDVEHYRAHIATLRKEAKKYKGTDQNALKTLVGTNLADWYWTLDDHEKRTLWRSVVDKIWYGYDKVLRVEFRQ